MINKGGSNRYLIFRKINRTVKKAVERLQEGGFKVNLKKLKASITTL